MMSVRAACSALRAWLIDHVGILVAAVVGAALRLDQIRDQILLGDEWHALHAIVRFDYAHILTHFGFTDVCIPLAVLDKALADTVGLSEMGVRFPVLLAGLATVLLVPLLLRPVVGNASSVGLAWLLAVSPLHIYFTRFARPYAITLLLAFGGALAFERWWQHGNRGWRNASIISLAFAPYFHLAMLPVVAAPIALAFVDCLRAERERERGRKPAEVFRFSVAVAVGLTILLGMPLAVDHAALAYKTARGQLDFTALQGALSLLTGLAHPALACAIVVVSGIGLGSLARRQFHLCLVLGAMAAAAPIAVIVGRPVSIEMPIVLARYCLFALPVILLGVACALAAAEEGLRARRLRLPKGALAMIAAALLLLEGPLPRIHAHPNNWTNHGLFQDAYDPGSLGWSCPAEVPAFYRQIAMLPPSSVRLLEAPWWHAWPLYPCYQQVHRQRMAIGFVAGPEGAMSTGGLPRPAEMPVLASHPAFRFRNFVHVTDALRLQREGFRYVVFHTRLEQEMDIHSVDYQNADVSRWLIQYRRVYGRPVYKDDWIQVFDIERARPAGSGDAGAP
jgi:hypothetical protein